MRPCDARGVRVLDAVFLEHEAVDPYYARRRENTVLIGLACQEMGENCFCTLLGGSPDDSADVDLMLAEVEGGFTLQVVTEKGERIAEGLSQREISPGITRPEVQLHRQDIFPAIDVAVPGSLASPL